jgi:zona occludens toxin (predicted ATPase)
MQLVYGTIRIFTPNISKPKIKKITNLLAAKCEITDVFRRPTAESVLGLGATVTIAVHTAQAQL